MLITSLGVTKEISVNNGIPNFYIYSKKKLSEYQQFINEVQFKFFPDYFEQKVSSEMVPSSTERVTENATSIFNWTFNNGLPKSTKDSYGILIENYYDTYGNLERTEK